MTETHGWITLRKTYKVMNEDDDEIDEDTLKRIDDEIGKIKYPKLQIRVNNANYYIEFSLYTNHRSDDVRQLIAFFETVGRIAEGSYSLLYIHDDEDKGYFEICSWHSWVFADIRKRMIEISSKYAKMNYTDSEFVIPIPQTALREIYAYIVNRSYLSGDEHFEVASGDAEWQIKNAYEKMNLINAEKLHALICTLESIKYDNDICIDEKYIADKNDLIALRENPGAYKWEFRIYNSY